MHQELLKKIDLIFKDKQYKASYDIWEALEKCRDELAKQSERIEAIRDGNTLTDQMLRDDPVGMYDAALILLAESDERVRELEAAVKELQFSDLGCCRGCDREDLDGCKPDCKYTKLLKGE